MQDKSTYNVSVVENPQVEGELITDTAKEGLSYIRLQQTTTNLDGRFIQTKNRRTLLMGSIDELNAVLKLANDQAFLPGKIVTVEATDQVEFRRLMKLSATADLTRYEKLAGKTGLHCLAEGGSVIYRGEYYTLRDVQDILVDHVNREEIQAANLAAQAAEAKANKNLAKGSTKK